jgi:outer membrane immunogenic protein
MLHSKFVAAVIATSAIVGVSAASAADMAPRTYTKAPPAPVVAVYNWTGLYIGVNGGGGWGRTDWYFNVVGTTANHDTSGGLAGGQIGYNWQANQWVFGVEADGDWANINGSTLCPNPAFICASNTRDLASFRGRVGWAAGPVLFYGTAGGAYANTRYSALMPAGGLPPTALGFATTDRWGYAAGVGIEWGFAPNWSAKVEYMHYGFDNVTVAPGLLGTNSAALGLNIDTVKAGVNYRFNWGGPVVARY